MDTKQVIIAIETLGTANTAADGALQIATAELATWIEGQVPEDEALPRGYRVVRLRSNVGVDTFLANADGEYLNADGGYLHGDLHVATPEASLDACARFADDVADGLLDEIKAWLAAREDKALARGGVLRKALTSVSALALVVASLGGCSTEECDSRGTYNLILEFGQGDCGLAGTDTDTMIITDGPGDTLAFSFPETTGATSSSAIGTVRDEGDGTCDIDITFSASFPADPADPDQITSDVSLRYQLEVVDDIDVTGTGTLNATFTAGDGTRSNCTQAMTVRGTKQ